MYPSFRIPYNSSYQEEADARRKKREKAMMKSKISKSMRPTAEGHEEGHEEEVPNPLSSHEGSNINNGSKGQIILLGEVIDVSRTFSARGLGTSRENSSGQVRHSISLSIFLSLSLSLSLSHTQAQTHASLSLTSNFVSLSYSLSVGSRFEEEQW
jgi:hypothetical protein